MRPGYKILLILALAYLLLEFMNKSDLMRPLMNMFNKSADDRIKAAARYADKPVAKSLVEFNDLFINKQDFKLESTLTFMSRKPVGKYIYRGHFNVLVYKIDSLSSLSLIKSVTEKPADAGLISNNYYAIDQFGYATFNYNNATIKKVDNIQLTLSGNNSRLITLNDSIAYYYTRVNNLSVSYNNRLQDLLVNSDDIPSELLILKRNHNIYLFFLTSDNPKAILEPNMLFDLVVSQHVNAQEGKKR